MGVPGNANTLLLKSAAAGGGAYQISRSLRFDSSASSNLSKTYASAGTQTTWTLSCWFKACRPGSDFRVTPLFSGSSPWGGISIYQDKFRFAAYNGAYIVRLETSQVIRDPSAWYHLVAVFDSTNATSTDRARLYLNGERITAFSTATYPSQNATTTINGTGAQYIGWEVSNNVYSDCYFADIHFLDGIATDPSSFAETNAITGQWVPKAYSGSYGTNGFRLAFDSYATTAALGTDSSGAGNSWTVNNFSVTAGVNNDSTTDTPTSYGTDTGVGGELRGNYATLNPLNIQVGAGSLSNGNLDFTGPSGSGAYNFVGSTFGIDTSTSTGWYFEYTQTTYGQFASIALLDQSVSASALNNSYIIGHSSANQTAGISYSNGGALGNYGTLTTGLTSWTSNGDVIGVAIKDNKIWFAKNNTWISGSPSAGTSPSITLASTKFVTPAAIGINSSLLSLNAGQRAFAYTAPSGFKALVDTNLPTPVVAKPDQVFQAKLYTGNGGTQNITGLAFSPDFVWLKKRNTSDNHCLFDTVRTALQQLVSNSTAAESTASATLTAFNSDGFTLGGVGTVNESSSSYVSWNWDAGTTTVSNSQGSITSQVRANPSAGFSVVTYTGTGSNATVGHGLGVAPRFIIVKSRSLSPSDWKVYHVSTGPTQRLNLDTTDAAAANSTVWNDTAPTSSVFSIGTNSDVGQSSATYVAYCWTPVSGYSSAFSYVGNGDSSGPFVYLGFRPKWLLVKETTNSNNWFLLDATRSPYNYAGDTLWPNLSNQENDTGINPNTTYNNFDFLSNGFKPRSAYSGTNRSGGTYIGFAFAESPFQYARAR